MRILKVTQSYYPFLERGGPAVKVRSLALGMSALGHTVTVLTADLGFTPATRELAHPFAGRWGLRTLEEGVEALFLRSSARYRALTWNPQIAAFCREQLSSYDIVHIYGLYDLLGPLVARACRTLGLPYVVEPMGMFRPIMRNIRMKRLYHAILGMPMLQGAQRIIATAEQERQELIDGGIPAAKITVRRNGIETPRELPARGQFRNQWGISLNAKLVLFLGRLVSKKSPEMMLEAFSRWQRHNSKQADSWLVLAGPDENDGYRSYLEGIAAKMGLNGGILFTGPLYGEAKWAAYRDADLFVLPSVNENFGNTAAEAIACGTPVLVTDTCGIAPLVTQRAGLVVQHNCAALETGLERILDNSAFAARLREGCPEVARSLTWEEPLAQMLAIYQELMVAGRTQ